MWTIAKQLERKEEEKINAKGTKFGKVVCLVDSGLEISKHVHKDASNNGKFRISMEWKLELYPFKMINSTMKTLFLFEVDSQRRKRLVCGYDYFVARLSSTHLFSNDKKNSD